MVGRVGIEKETGESMKDDEELEMLLSEIPHATSLNFHHPHSNGHYHVHGDHDHGCFVTHKINGMDDDEASSHCKYKCASPASGFSLKSDGSSSSLFSGGHSLSDNGSQTPPSLDELKSHMIFGNFHSQSGLSLDSKLPDSSIGMKSTDNMSDKLSLSRNLSRLFINEEQDEFSMDSNRFPFREGYRNGTNQVNAVRSRSSYDDSKVFSDCGVVQSSLSKNSLGFYGQMNSAMLGFRHDYRPGNLLESRYFPRTDGCSSLSNCGKNPMSFQRLGAKDHAGYYYHKGATASNMAAHVSRPSLVDALHYAQQHGMNLIKERGVNSTNVHQSAYSRPDFYSERTLHHYAHMLNGRMTASSNTRVPQEGFEALTGEDSLIITGKGVNNVMSKGFGPSSGHNTCKSSLHEIGVAKPQEKRLQLDSCENGRTARMQFPFSLPLKCNTLAEAQGCIYLLAKDQHGCRFLQRMFEEGTPEDVHIIFSEIIDHAVELMVNPFGNYLMQKLMEACNEEQRMQILLMVTEEPGELVRISLNTHGTRVVQKLIETLKTRQQIALVISALEPGFLALTKDLNGNHVVQRCLQCLSNEDNKFIYVAAAKYCVDIASHQHGCCVLQRCISHSNGKYRENLVAEITANGFLLAQDAFGNYVVQFILELKIAYATSKLISQFEGNYVHLSTQKFSSHVVEKCLVVSSDEVRSKIIHELLSASHFEQMLQDPHGNYVVQTALRVSEGSLHNALVDAIESHKAISRNSPYSKRIFSHKLLRK